MSLRPICAIFCDFPSLECHELRPDSIGPSILGDSGGGTVEATVVVSGVLLVGVSAVQYYHPFWPDFLCGTDPSV